MSTLATRYNKGAGVGPAGPARYGSGITEDMLVGRVDVDDLLHTIQVDTGADRLVVSSLFDEALQVVESITGRDPHLTRQNFRFEGNGRVTGCGYFQLIDERAAEIASRAVCEAISRLRSAARRGVREAVTTPQEGGGTASGAAL